MKRDEIFGGIAIFLFGMATALLSLGMPIGTFRMAGTGLFPLCLGILLMVLSVLFLLKLYVKGKKLTGKKPMAELTGATKQMLLFLGAIVFATLFFNKLGYPLISFLLMVALLRILGMRRWIFNISLSFMTAVVCYFLFVNWLKIPLPKGWIGL